MFCLKEKLQKHDPYYQWQLLAIELTPPWLGVQQ